MYGDDTVVGNGVVNAEVEVSASDTDDIGAEVEDESSLEADGGEESESEADGPVLSEDEIAKQEEGLEEKEQEPEIELTLREKYVAKAKECLGCPYVYGDEGPDSFDCSGFVYYVTEEVLGIVLPRRARDIYTYCEIIPDEEIEIGDLVFFNTGGNTSVSHIGIYIGEGKFISALSEGKHRGVSISWLQKNYWGPKYMATGRIMPSEIEPVVEVIEEGKISDDKIENVLESIVDKMMENLIEEVKENEKGDKVPNLITEDDLLKNLESKNKSGADSIESVNISDEELLD